MTGSTLETLRARVGEELGVSAWRRIAQAEVDAFAALTGDRQWIHVDVERATREAGGTIVHGLYVLSLLPGMAQEVLPLAGVSRALNYGFDRVRFVAPLPTGARVRLRLLLAGAEEKAGGLLLTQSCTVEVEGADRPAVVADWLALLFA
jgi:acyl dehydratase